MAESQSHLLHIGTQADQYLHALAARVFDCCGFLSRRATRKLIRQIEEVKPDVIQLHNLHGYYLNIPLLFDYLKQSGVPVVWTLHDCWAFTGHCVHYTCVNCFKWQTGCFDCPRRKSYPSSFVLDRSKRNYMAKSKAYSGMPDLNIVTVSHWLGDVCASSMLGDYPIRVIQNGVDLDVFRPRTEAVKQIRSKYGLSDKYVILGVATGWSEEVGLSAFGVLREHLSDDFAIVLVGATPEVMRKLPDGIVGIPRVSNIDELAAIYSAADILFNASYQETFGLVTAEAISCGTPAIVYDSTACPEIVTPETGYVAPAKDVNKVLDIIRRDAEISPSDRADRAGRCREYALDHFDVHSRYQQYIDLYKSLLSD